MTDATRHPDTEEEARHRLLNVPGCKWCQMWAKTKSRATDDLTPEQVLAEALIALDRDPHRLHISEAAFRLYRANLIFAALAERGYRLEPNALRGQAQVILIELDRLLAENQPADMNTLRMWRSGLRAAQLQAGRKEPESD